MFDNSLYALTLAFLAGTLVALKALSAKQTSNYHAIQGFILHNKVTHSRLLPKTASHTFSHPTLFFLVSLRALESRTLDLGGGWLFGYGGLYWRLTGLRPSAYLAAEKKKTSIIEKLGQVLRDRMLDADEFEDAWMLTMPSLLGFEGINPLTVYFCYKRGGELCAVVLEIHNTFSERHVHMLPVGPSQDPCPPEGFTHQWTFPRTFHVSPFNDRSGYYTVSMKTPVAPSLHRTASPMPMPRVRVFLHTSTSDSEPSVGPVKLAAFLTPANCVPLSSGNLLWSLLLQPLALFLSMPRILYQAWILHYKKRLSVYVRPDPYHVTDGCAGEACTGGGVGWQPETWTETFARKRVEAFLRRRLHETGISVTLLAANPAISRIEFSQATTSKERRHLTISYMSPEFFTTLFAAPSFAHARLLYRSTGCCRVSSEDLLQEVLFNAEDGEDRPGRSSMTIPQLLRELRLPEKVRRGQPDLQVPHRHPIDPGEGISLAYIATIGVLLISNMLAWIEDRLYRATGATFVAGQEPWKRWERALGLESLADLDVRSGRETGYILGSAQR